jgi:hypothetical protein
MPNQPNPQQPIHNPNADLIKETFLLGYLYEKDIPGSILSEIREFFSEFDAGSSNELLSLLPCNFDENLQIAAENDVQMTPGAKELLEKLVAEAISKGIKEIVLLPYKKQL